MAFHPNGVDARVGSTPARHAIERLEHIDFFVIDRFSSGSFLRDAQPVREPIDGDDPLGAEQGGARNRELADGPAAPDRNDIPWLDVARLGRCTEFALDMLFIAH